MGCDGGTIPKRHELVKGPPKAQKVWAGRGGLEEGPGGRSERLGVCLGLCLGLCLGEPQGAGRAGGAEAGGGARERAEK